MAARRDSLGSTTNPFCPTFQAIVIQTIHSGLLLPTEVKIARPEGEGVFLPKAEGALIEVVSYQNNPNIEVGCI